MPWEGILLVRSDSYELWMLVDARAESCVYYKVSRRKRRMESRRNMKSRRSMESRRRVESRRRKDRKQEQRKI